MLVKLFYIYLYIYICLLIVALWLVCVISVSVVLMVIACVIGVVCIKKYRLVIGLFFRICSADVNRTQYLEKMLHIKYN